MSYLLSYFISFLIGLNIVYLLLRNSRISNPSLYFFLGVGVGLGCSSILTFYSFLIFHKFSSFMIISFNLILLALLCLINVSTQRESKKEASQQISWHASFRIPDALIWFCWMILFGMIGFHAHAHPFGEWDGWALWNMKTKFLLLGGVSWDHILYSLHWHTQPDYPLLLPFMNVWAAAFIKQYTYHIPIITASLLTISCCILIYTSLREFIRKEIAFLAALIPAVNPFYVFLGTAQYADILLGYYLLATVIMIIFLIQEKSNSIAILTGLFLGLMTFTKNEGIIMAILFLGILIIYLLSRKESDKKAGLQLIAFLVLGMAITASATFIFKLFLAPPNRDIGANLTANHLQFLNWQGAVILLRHAVQELLARPWCYVWLLITFLVVVKIPEFFKNECKVISLFFICYFLILTGVYLTTVNFDLSWRLTRTFGRILFYLFPSILFFCFYVHWKDHSINKNYNQK